MPVDVFGKTTTSTREDSQHVIFRGLTRTQANDKFLRRDGENAAEGDINPNSHKLVNVADPTSDKDAANKEYVDSTGTSSKVSKSGDTMTGDLLFSINEENGRVLGCLLNLPVGKIFDVAFGNLNNQIQFHNGDEIPLSLHTTDGLMVCVDNNNMCKIGGSAALSVYKNIEMNSNRIMYLTQPTFAHEAVPKFYVDRKFLDLTILSYEGHIPQLEHSISKTGFIASASSQKGPHYGVRFAFSSNSNKEWAVNRVGVRSWIQISCPTPVRIWKIRLTGRKTRSNQPRITSWKLSAGTGSEENETLTDIHTKHNITTIHARIRDRFSEGIQNL